MTTTKNNSITTALSQVERDEIREVFELFDAEGKGTINTKELKQVMESLQLEEKAVAPFRDGLVKQHRQEIDFETFQRLVLSKRNKANDWRYVFDLFDTEGKGYITKDNLASVAENLGENMSSEELQEMMDRANSSKGEKVTFQEFQAIMTKNLFST
jgi:Ca2+-binding EF-hand superfamily protein